MSTKTEFYVGLVSTMAVMFLMPLISSALEIGLWPFIGYLYLGVGMYFIGHAIRTEEKEYLEGKAAPEVEGGE